MPGTQRAKRHRWLRVAPRCPNADAGLHARRAAVRRGRGRSHGRLHPSGRHGRDRGAAACGRRGDRRRRAGARSLGAVQDFLVGGMFRPRDLRGCERREFYARHQNEFLGVVGESGSGKTTLARLLVGWSGPAQVLSGSPASEVMRQHLAVAPQLRHDTQLIFQDPQSALNPRRRVGSIVTQSMEAAGTVSREERLARAAACWPRSACRPRRGALSLAALRRPAPAR